ncbi:MAG: hypothetical protein ACE37M_10070 [Henriciella sp.]
MKAQTLLASTAFLIAGSLAVPMASAECDISETKCAVNGNKCNIKFRNKTGEASGSSGGTSLDQTTMASYLWISARDDNGDRVGNKLSLGLGENATMNLSKKAKKENGFESIKAMVQEKNGPVDPARISCEEIKTILNGTGSCKIFHGRKKGTTSKYALGYECDSGRVAGPK